MKGLPSDDEDAWWTVAKVKTSVLTRYVPESPHHSNLIKNDQEERSFTDTLRDLFWGEQRDPPEERDNIESHRKLMERPRDIVTQNYYAAEVESEKRVKKSMLKVANQTLDEKEIIKRYLVPETETNNSAILFLAGTLFSSNRFIFELLNENGVFSPRSQNLVNSLASDFITQSKQLSDVLLKAERTSGVAAKKLVVSCVNNFVSTSNRLVTVLEEELNEKALAINSAKEVMLNNIITRRNRISDYLYDFFRRTVEVEKSISSTSASSVPQPFRVVNSSQYLIDAEKFTNFLYTDVDKTQGSASDKMTNGIKNSQRNLLDQKEDDVYNGMSRKFRTELRDLDDKIMHHKTISDRSDLLSTASSFLDFINESSLSLMFEEDERDMWNAGVSETHLDEIFQRMNLTIPKDDRKNVDDTSVLSTPSKWGKARSKTSQPKRKQSTAKASAKEKHRQKIRAQNHSRNNKEVKHAEKNTQQHTEKKKSSQSKTKQSTAKVAAKEKQGQKLRAQDHTRNDTKTKHVEKKKQHTEKKKSSQSKTKQSATKVSAKEKQGQKVRAQNHAWNDENLQHAGNKKQHAEKIKSRGKEFLKKSSKTRNMKSRNSKDTRIGILIEF